jgi:hypothetical protein
LSLKLVIVSWNILFWTDRGFVLPGILKFAARTSASCSTKPAITKVWSLEGACSKLYRRAICLLARTLLT